MVWLALAWFTSSTGQAFIPRFAGDLDHDGYADFWIGDNRNDDNGEDSGAMSLFYGGE